MIKRLFFIFFILGNLPLFAQQQIAVTNNFSRYDVKGNIVDAHDGRIIQFGKKYYWYGTKYGTTNGFTTANEYVCYSSDNLQNWKWVGVLLPQKPAGVYYRPHVVFNAATKKYVLWYNWYPQLWKGQFGVAESSSPGGPFTIINDSVPVKHAALGVGDHAIFVNDDNTAYIGYNTISGHQLSIEKLNASYTASTFENSGFITDNCEAGAMFKRNNQYYLLTDYTCCFCTQGSGARVYTAASPMGPFKLRQNINRYPGTLSSLLNDNVIMNNDFETLSAKDSNALELRFSSPRSIKSFNIYQFTGDRNGQCGEVNNPVLHEPITRFKFTFQYFYEGVWKQITSVATSVQQQALMQVYNISMPELKAERLIIKPMYDSSNTILKLAEIKFHQSFVFSVYKTGMQEGKPIIPAQQTCIAELKDGNEKRYIWMGDMWGSATDNVKGHDFQFWSAPLQFYKNGLIRSIEWSDRWNLNLKK
jgi:hypothetical protein